MELQDVINTANVNLDRMSDDPNPFISRKQCDRTPVSKVIHQQDNQETPRNTSHTNIGSDGDTIHRSLYGSLLKKKWLSLTSSVNTQHEDVLGDKVKSPLSVDTQDLLDQSLETDSGRNNVEDSLESDRQSILQ